MISRKLSEKLDGEVKRLLHPLEMEELTLIDEHLLIYGRHVKHSTGNRGDYEGNPF